jgi:hypothetical protein
MSLEKEFCGANLGDERLNSRLLELAGCFARRHGGAISFSCPDWKMAKSAYRFFDNSRFDETAILAPHIAATHKRVNSTEETVLVVHDTTEFHYTHHNKTEGLGYLSRLSRDKSFGGKAYSQGFLMHTSLALTTDDIPLGILSEKLWVRKGENLKKVRGAGKNFTRVPIEEKESYKWIEGISASCEEATHKENLVHVCDRDGDIYELFDSCINLGTNFVVRAVHPRGTARKGVKSFAKLSRLAAQGSYVLNITSSQKRAARKAKILVKFYKVTIIPPIAKARDYQPLEIYVVSAKERITKNVPEKERVNWKLLTNKTVESFEQALEKIRWYQARWNIEIFFKTLKSGFGLDKSRLRSFERMKKFAAFVSIIAWRVFWLTKISRACPKAPPNIAFSALEKKVITKLAVSDGRTPPKCNTLTDWVNALAALGGYLNRKSDPPPGNIVILRGIQRLFEASAILRKNTCG